MFKTLVWLCRPTYKASRHKVNEMYNINMNLWVGKPSSEGSGL